MDAGLLAIKRSDQAKQRLSGSFTAAERSLVARAMQDDALALCAASTFLRWWVVSDDDEVLQRARDEGFEVVRDEGAGLNPALLTSFDALLAAGMESVTIVPTDIPLARPEDIEAILETGATSEMVVVPSRDGGTNALYLRPPDLIAPRFGEKSLQAHIAAAEMLKLRCTVLPLERMALDIDTPEHVERLIEVGGEVPTRTYQELIRLRPPAAAQA
jgi:2-phospho-L-lactate guanylyltransferase